MEDPTILLGLRVLVSGGSVHPVQLSEGEEEAEWVRLTDERHERIIPSSSTNTVNVGGASDGNNHAEDN